MSKACHLPFLIETNPWYSPLIFSLPSGAWFNCPYCCFMAITLNLKSIMVVGTWTLERSPWIVLTCMLLPCQVSIWLPLLPHNPLWNSEIYLRCHLQKVLEVPLVDTAVLIHGLGIKDSRSLFWWNVRLFSCFALCWVNLRQTAIGSQGRGLQPTDLNGPLSTSASQRGFLLQFCFLLRPR